MVASVVLFGWHVFFFLVPILMGFAADFYSLKVVLFIIQMSLQLVAAITTWRLIKGFRTANVDAYLQGRTIFFVLAIYESF